MHVRSSSDINFGDCGSGIPLSTTHSNVYERVVPCEKSQKVSQLLATILVLSELAIDLL